MFVGKNGFGGPASACSQALPNRLREAAATLPRPVRFLLVGGFGLIADIGFFTLFFAFGAHALVARAFSLALATIVTWRLNRHLTFKDSGRHQADEAARYALVAAVAQGTGYLIFAVLALTVFSKIPQIAIVIGAVAVTLLSYNGQRLIAFAPRKAPVLGHSTISAQKAAP
jgi:putative flippase GtrA